MEVELSSTVGSYIKFLRSELHNLLTGMSLKASGSNSSKVFPLSLNTCSLPSFINILGTSSTNKLNLNDNIRNSVKCLNAPLCMFDIRLWSKFSSTKFTRPRKLWSSTEVMLLNVKSKTLMLGTPQKECIPSCFSCDLLTINSSKCLRCWKMGEMVSEFGFFVGASISRISTLVSTSFIGSWVIPPFRQDVRCLPRWSFSQVQRDGHKVLVGVQIQSKINHMDACCQLISILKKHNR